MALGHDHSLGEEVVGQLRVERQIEANRALADIEAPALDVRIGLQQVLDGWQVLQQSAQIHRRLHFAHHSGGAALVAGVDRTDPGAQGLRLLQFDPVQRVEPLHLGQI